MKLLIQLVREILHSPEKVREFQKPLTVATMTVDFNNKFAVLSVDL